MIFSYAVPARRFYGARAIDSPGLHFAANRPLVDNVGALALAEWGLDRAARAEQLARLVTSADPQASDPANARQWAAAILCATAGDRTSRTLLLIEDRTGVTPTETAARHDALTALLSDRQQPSDDGVCGLLAH